jgi:GT2 family glycosyltransferase/glycosyltransferase involved in cell wall biosynthesis
VLFRDRDLALRLAAAALPARAGYALTCELTPRLGGSRLRYVAEVVQRHVLEILGDPMLAEAAGRGYVPSIACDDLDALTGWLWPRNARLRGLVIEGAEHLPAVGRSVFATFHVSGGFRIYDALCARGFRPAMLGALPERSPSRYQRLVDRSRLEHLRRELDGAILRVGPAVARDAVRSPAAHLASGGAVVTALDVSPAALGLRDVGSTSLFDRAVELPIGLLRLAAGSATPVVPFDARLERGRRILRFHRAITSRDPGEVLAHVVRALEGSIRERPWDWQGWLDVDRLLGKPCGAAADDGDSAHALAAVRDASGDRPGLSIVVPVHDAAEDTKRCIASVLAHAPADAGVVIVDDASDDAGLRRWLDALPGRDARVRLLRNAANLGYVGSANRGLRELPGRDIVLLNSDTVVPAGFAERLADAARHTPSTGIVSPFTNNGTIFGLPVFMRDNPLPEGLDSDAFDALVAGISLRRRPQVVTAHGFCVYLRAEVLDRVGLLDEERFGRGYGEENDLCERATKAGFEVRLCDDLFVYHRGGSSFGAEAGELELRNLETIERLHPGYRARAQAFIAANPLAELQESVRYHLGRRSARRSPALLFILHASPFADPKRGRMGGTQYHALDLARSLGLPRAVVAWPEEDGLHAAEILSGDVDRPRLHRVSPPAPERSFSERRLLLRDRTAEAQMDALLALFDVGAVHLHHLAWWPVGMWRRLSAHGVPYVFMVQDYYSVCPSWNLLDLATAARCACTAGSAAERHRCLGAWFGACGLAPPDDPEAHLAEHRAEFRALLEHAAAVVAPCEATREIVDHAHPGAAIPWRVIPYGYEHPGAPARPRAPGRLRVALLGAVAAPWKGAEQVLAAMRRARTVDLEWHVFGDSAAYGFPERAAEAVGDGDRLRFHGGYAREEIVALLRASAVDVSVLLSPWDETYCYTLSESWAAGVPAIVSDRGALAERTRASGAGIVAQSPDEVAEALGRLAREPERLAALARAAEAHRELSPAENAARHRAAYPEVFARLATRQTDPPYGELDRALYEAFLRAHPA